MNAQTPRSKDLILILSYGLFMMFAMTTDAIGVIIPRLLSDYRLGLAASGSFHYASMIGIALSGLGLGLLADRLGRKWSLRLGLGLFALSNALMMAVDRFEVLALLFFVSGVAIGLFKTGALALVGDVTPSKADHTKTMSWIEGFFALGAILGPVIVTHLLLEGASWKSLYGFSSLFCIILMMATFFIEFPSTYKAKTISINFSLLLDLGKQKIGLYFAFAEGLYVCTEAAIYVWMPTLLLHYTGDLKLLALYALPIFFGLRALGRFLGPVVLDYLGWQRTLGLACALVAMCFGFAIGLGQTGATIFLPLSGLFMSVIYPILNSKGISSFPRNSQGLGSGILLFFTCVSAVLSPLIMGALGDHFQNPLAGFYLAALMALALAILVWFRLPKVSEQDLD